MYFLNRVLAEKNKQINGYEEWIHMKEIFESLLSQAGDNNVDYYDELLIVEKKTMAWQANLMSKYGIYGQCFYHYYFKAGRKINVPIIEIEELIKLVNLDGK